ncbi:MAG TPA: hypothetical protein VHA07_07125 [Devosia sp.]|nr:hypothetical protein [Devosia sp.]
MALAKTCGRSAALAALLLVSIGLSACTTTEGTNAFTSAQTFETEVMDKTAQGLGLIPAPVKPDPTNPRGPLVMPKDTSALPPPQTETVTAMLPADDATPKIDTAGLSQADIERARHARIVDINTPDGRPLTAAELQKLTSRMKAYTLSSKRSIFTPPEQYFTLDNGQKDLVCLAKNGDLVPVNDPNCPLEIRKALLKQG